MERRYDRTYMRQTEYQETKSRGRIGAIIFMVVLALCAVIVLLILNYRNKGAYAEWSALEYIKTPIGSREIPCDSGIISYNSDGAICYGSDSDAVWQISYNMRNPSGAACGDYAIFGDLGEYGIAITDGTGMTYSYSVSGRIDMVDISSNGIAAVMVDYNDTDRIYLFDINGNLLLDIETSVKKAGFPITMTISPDGRKLVTSYLQVGEEQKTSLTFYNFGDVGQSYIDKIVGNYYFENKVIPDIRFIGSDRVCAIWSTGCIFYKFPEVPEEIKTLSEPGGYSGVANDDKNILLAKKQTDGGYLFTIYDKNGVSQGEVQTSFGYDNLFIGQGEVILSSESSCVIYRIDGEEKFRTKLDAPIREIVTTNDPATYLVLYDEAIGRIRLKTRKEIEAEERAQAKAEAKALKSLEATE